MGLWIREEGESMGELLLIAQVLKAVYEYFKFVQSLAAAPDPATLRELYIRVVGLELHVARLSRDVENLAWQVRRGEVIQITRAVDAQRAAYKAALQYTMDHPGTTAGEVTALAAANALASASFSTFPGRTDKSPDRFDPRATLPSFLEAVNAWLALRKTSNSSWTETSKEALLGFASRLDAIIAGIRSSVECIERYTSYDLSVVSPWVDPYLVIEDPPSLAVYEWIPPEPRCGHVVMCFDSMRENVEWLVSEDTLGYCEITGSKPWVSVSNSNGFYKQSYLDAYYMPNRLQEIAQGWRALV
jgi:hypothetical protein